MSETLTCQRVHGTMLFQRFAVLPGFRYQTVANLVYYSTVFVWRLYPKEAGNGPALSDLVFQHIANNVLCLVYKGQKEKKEQEMNINLLFFYMYSASQSYPNTISMILFIPSSSYISLCVSSSVSSVLLCLSSLLSLYFQLNHLFIPFLPPIVSVDAIDTLRLPVRSSQDLYRDVSKTVD